MNLCWIYDNNHITIEGSTALAFSGDVATRATVFPILLRTDAPAGDSVFDVLGTRVTEKCEGVCPSAP